MSLIKNKKRILVEIIGGAFPQKKKCRIEGNNVIVKEGAKGRGGAEITAEYDNSCLVPYMAGFPPFRHVKYKLILREGASKCQSWAEKELESAPSCTKEDVARYGEATVIKLAGALKPPFNLGILYILVIISIIVGLITLAVATGSVRL